MLVALVFSRSLICATVPVMVTDEVPELVTIAPLLPAVTVSVPSVTASVTRHRAGAGIHVRYRQAVGLQR